MPRRDSTLRRHVIRRAKQHYGLKLSHRTIQRIEARIAAGQNGKLVHTLSKCMVVLEIMLYGKPQLILFDTKKAKIITFAPPKSP